jgi:hypothetical protein
MIERDYYFLNQNKMDFLGQEIHTGDYIIVMTKGTGWDKNTYFSTNVAVRTTEHTVFFGDPEDQGRAKKEKVFVITEEQMQSYLLRLGREDRIEELQQLREKIIL